MRLNPTRSRWARRPVTELAHTPLEDPHPLGYRSCGRQQSVLLVESRRREKTLDLRVRELAEQFGQELTALLRDARCSERPSTVWHVCHRNGARQPGLSRSPRAPTPRDRPSADQTSLPGLAALETAPGRVCPLSRWKIGKRGADSQPCCPSARETPREAGARRRGRAVRRRSNCSPSRARRTPILRGPRLRWGARPAVLRRRPSRSQ